MVNNFTHKEMLVRMMDKLDSIEEKLNATHEQACSTNGKVRLHTKLIIGLSTGLISLAGWIFSILIK